MAEYANHNFKWNLPSSMAEYANHNFKTYITNNDIEEQLITQNPLSSNFQQVKPPDDFIKWNQMERFQGKILKVMGLLSRLWERL